MNLDLSQLAPWAQFRRTSAPFVLLFVASISLFADGVPLKTQAEVGDVRAQFLIGKSQLSSHSSQDWVDAFKWLTLAANNKHQTAQYLIATMHLEGKGTVTNTVEGFRYAKSSAEQGYAPGQSLLGECYMNGWGTSRDSKAAAEWFDKAANQGLADAQFHLGKMYNKGNGVPQDFSKSVKWLRRAANQGHQKAQSTLLQSILAGEAAVESGEIDYVEAYQWATLIDNDKCRKQTANKLTVAQLTAAAERAADFKPKPELDVHDVSSD